MLTVRLPVGAADVTSRAALLSVCLAAPAVTVRAQARPDGAGRPWVALALEGAGQAQRCAPCGRPGAVGGPAVSLAAGHTLPRRFGVAVVGRTFREFSFEYSQASQYALAVGQYTPPRLAPLTVNLGAGWGRHRGEAAPYANNGQAAVLGAGLGMRLPRRSAVGLALTADVVQAVGGAAAYRPRLVSVGLGVSAARASGPAPGR